MYSRKVVVAAVASLLLIGGLGGCPALDALSPEGDSSQVFAPNGTADTDSDSQTQDDTPFSLEELQRSLVSGNARYRETISTGYSTISINPSIDVGDTYEHPDPPPVSYDADNAGGDQDDDNDGDNADSDDSGNDTGGDDGDDDPADDPPSGSNIDTYEGQTTCSYYESLEDNEQFYGELFREVTCEVSLAFNTQGVPETIPVPPFTGGTDGDRWQIGVHFVNETETFEYMTDGVMYTVTVRVSAATYTAQAAHVELELDCSWYGDSSSIVAEGNHTLDTMLTSSGIQYTASTDYEGVFTADGEADEDDWVGYGVVAYDCGGMLTD